MEYTHSAAVWLILMVGPSNPHHCHHETLKSWMFKQTSSQLSVLQGAGRARVEPYPGTIVSRRNDGGDDVGDDGSDYGSDDDSDDGCHDGGDDGGCAGCGDGGG